MVTLGMAALAVALTAHVELLARLRRAEPASPWWFGYARDAANLAAVLMLWGSYVLCELRAPEALLLAMLTGLATYLLDWTVARALKTQRPRSWLMVPLAAWVALFAWAHREISDVATLLIRANQPR
jgi:hypothetical protein